MGACSTNMATRLRRIDGSPPTWWSATTRSNTGGTYPFPAPSPERTRAIARKSSGASIGLET